MYRWSITKKAVILTLVPTLCISLTLATAFVKSRLTDLNERFISEGTAASDYLAKAAEQGLMSGNASQLITLAGVAQQKNNIKSATIYGRKGQILAHSGSIIREAHTIPASFTDKPALYRSKQVLRFSTPVKLSNLSIIETSSRLKGSEALSIGKIIGWVIIDVSRKDLQKDITDTFLLAISAVLMTTCLCLALAFSFSRSLTKPLKVLSKALSNLKDGDLNSRVHLKSTPEILDIQAGINSLKDSLANTYAEIQANTDKATRELRETLETIEVQNIELDLARKEALQASQVKSEFLANMSHEIRTPLNGIIGFTKLLSKSSLNIQQRDQLNTILKSSEILLTIINDILDFSKIEADKLVLDSIPLNLNEIVEDVLTMLAPGAHEKNLDLAGLVYSDVPKCIIGDPLRFKQIITNLVSNGIKFSQSGEVVVRVMLEDDSKDKALIKITVTDTGIGLSRVQQQSLFGAFSQADVSTARQFGGTGLGLVISRRLTEQMGGQIGAESELGRGSEFWILIPVKLGPEDHEVAYEFIPPINKERFIYLESQQKTKLAVSHMLNKWRAVVDYADTMDELTEAVMAAQQQNAGYSVAIIGITRNQLGSATLLEVVRRLEYELDCRTLLLTPTVDAVTEEPPALAEASNYLTKPASQKRLANTLTQLVSGSYPQETRHSVEHIDAKITNLRKPKILAVDDNSANLKLITALIEDFGVTIDAVNSGYEALNRVRLRRYDIIFMDVQMPGMDGIATTSKIRELEIGKKRTPIVAITAHAMREEKEKLLTSGFDDYLTKPTNEDQLKAIIAKQTGFTVAQNFITAHAKLPVEHHPSAEQQNVDPCVDIGAGIQLAGHKPDLAEELFSMLVENLPADREVIIDAYRNAEFEKLLETVHKLHGATRYCGVPVLRKAAAELESQIKRKTPDLTKSLTSLLNEIERVIYWVECNDWQKNFRNHSLS